MATFHIKTFGCQQNVADSERMVRHYEGRGDTLIDDPYVADTVVINSCMIREKAEERVYGFIRNLRKNKSAQEQRIILTGCITGAAVREPSGKLKKKLAKRVPDVELMPLEEIGFETPPKREIGKKHAWVIISNGCNNYCTFCIVPFSRGREISRPFENIIKEVEQLVADGYNSVTLLGQNVNSYGSDLVLAQKKESKEGTQGKYTLPDGTDVEPIYVKHLGRYRIPTLFPHLLKAVAEVDGVDTLTFTSANPWDYSDELIQVISEHGNIDRLLHLPVQSGSDKILKEMNRWYASDDYRDLIERIRISIPDVTFATDIIVGFPGETDEDFQETVRLCQDVGFVKAFVSQYSPRPGTAATGKMEDDISRETKKERWEILNDLVNVPNKTVSYEKDWLRTSTRKVAKK